MDIKTLSTVIGHVSSATTLNVYAHITDEMRQSAVAKIDRAIAKVESQPEPAVPKKPTRTTFQADTANRGRDALHRLATIYGGGTLRKSTGSVWLGILTPQPRRNARKSWLN